MGVYIYRYIDIHIHISVQTHRYTCVRLGFCKVHSDPLTHTHHAHAQQFNYCCRCYVSMSQRKTLFMGGAGGQPAAAAEEPRVILAAAAHTICIHAYVYT